METASPKVSAVIMAYNDEPNMRACLESVTWADEIVVVDSFSTDRTAVIAKEFTDRIFQHEFRGFGRLRNEATARASHDWIFSLDTDERATPEVRDEVRRTMVSGQADAYFIPRKNFFLGRWIRHCGFYPDYRQPQLFRKGSVRYREGDVVHEGFDITGKAGYFTQAIFQYPFRNIDHYLAKMDRYSDLMARRMAAQGRRFRPHQLVSHPLFTFLKMYVGRSGWRDGMPGLILSGLYGYYTFLKYAKFWEIQVSDSSKGLASSGKG